jgi:hypothetical protein
LPWALFPPALLPLIPDFLGFNLWQDVVMLLTFDDVLQLDLSFLPILQVQPPSRDLVDICSVHGFSIAHNPVQARLRELPRPVTLMVFQLCKRFKKPHFSCSLGRDLSAS